MNDTTDIQILYSISAMTGGRRKFIRGIDRESASKIVGVLLEKGTGQITLCRELPEGEAGRLFSGDRD